MNIPKNPPKTKPKIKLVIVINLHNLISLNLYHTPGLRQRQSEKLVLSFPVRYHLIKRLVFNSLLLDDLVPVIPELTLVPLIETWPVISRQPVSVNTTTHV